MIDYYLQKQSPDVFYKKGVLRNFTKFTRKHLCQSPFLKKLQKKRLWHRCFPVDFVKFLITLFSQNTSGDCFCTERIISSYVNSSFSFLYFFVYSWNAVNYHYLRYIQIRSFFWSVFYHIWNEHGDLRRWISVFSPNLGKYRQEIKSVLGKHKVAKFLLRARFVF